MAVWMADGHSRRGGRVSRGCSEGSRHDHTTVRIYSRQPGPETQETTFQAVHQTYFLLKVPLGQTVGPLLSLLGVGGAHFVGLGEGLHTEHAPLPLPLRKYLPTATQHTEDDEDCDDDDRDVDEAIFM